MHWGLSYVPSFPYRRNMATLTHFIRSIWPWHWQRKHHTGVHVYEECLCPMRRRRVRRVGEGHQPVDKHWLRGGSWEKPAPEPGTPTRVDPSMCVTREDLTDEF